MTLPLSLDLEGLAGAFEAGATAAMVLMLVLTWECSKIA